MKPKSLQDIIGLILDSDFSPEAKCNWEEVTSQAIRHTRDSKPLELLEAVRPNESDFIKTYRLDNYRAITNEGVVKFNDKSARIINKSHYTIANKSDQLSEYLEETIFSAGNGESVSFEQYFSRVILPCSFEDPNAILISFPFNSDNESVPPANSLEDGGLAPNELISVRLKVISSLSIEFINEFIFAYVDDKLWPYADFNGEIKHAPFYWICDRSNWYRLIPSGSQSKENREIIKYEAELWYNHDTGQSEQKELPVNILGGTLTKDTDDYSVTYNNSFLKPYFEYGDEVITTLSDFQAVKVKSAYPVKVMTKRPCQTCSGTGKVKQAGFRGGGTIQCHDCGGSATEKGLSPFKDLIVEPKGSFDSGGSDRPPLEYVSPDVNILKFLDESWQDLFRKAKQSINLDLLESVAESGEAKKHRMQDLQDMLMKIAGNLFDVMERSLWFTECLLNSSRSQRQKPILIRPVSFEIKDETMLRAEANESHPADAVSSLMEFYKKKYAGNEELIRVKELALMYAPLLAITDPQELQIRLLGAYSQDDIIKRDRAEFVFKQLADNPSIDIMSDDVLSLFASADDVMARFLPNTTPLV